jgi:hypothetical protein
MALKSTLKTLDGLDETVASLYKNVNGSYVLDLGDDDLSEHPNVRALKNSMQNAKGERDELRSKLSDLEGRFKAFDGLDAEAAREAIKKIQEASDNDLLDAGKVDELVAQKTERMRADFEAQMAAKDSRIGELESSSQTLNGELSNLKIFGEVERAALAKGVRETALDDVRHRASQVWALDDNGAPIARNGEERVFGKDGNALTIDEWVGELATNAEHLFKPSGGGNSQGNNGQSNQAQSGDVRYISAAAAGDNLAAIAAGEAVISD